MNTVKFLVAAAFVASLSGCLDTDGERAVAGAAAGAVIADVADTSVAGGAIAGAAAGALCDDVGICD